MADSEVYKAADWIASTRRKLRLLVLLDTAERAGLVPLSILKLHSFAYLANVLSPVWNLTAQDGKILKRRGGPFYPGLQHDLDRLVGMGVVQIYDLGYSLNEANRWRLEGSYRLNRAQSDRILQRLIEFEDEQASYQFIQELAYALSSLTDEEIGLATVEDATYSDPLVGVGNVVDFAEWRKVNYSSNAAIELGHQLPNTSPATLGEQIHFYVRHLRSRLQGGR